MKVTTAKLPRAWCLLLLLGLPAAGAESQPASAPAPGTRQTPVVQSASAPSPATRRGQAAPATAPAQADVLAAETLTHDALSLGHMREGVAGAGRILALLQFARRLDRDGTEVNRALADLYEGMGDLSGAAEAAEAYIRRRPEDFGMAARWIRLAEEAGNKAEDRIALLKGILLREGLPAEVRADAAGKLCGLYARQGDTASAEEACRLALSLDPYQATALGEQGRLPGQDRPVEAFTRALTIFRGNPRSLPAAWELAQRLQAAGVHDRAVGLYEHAYVLGLAKRPAPAVQAMLMTDYFNVLLDAHQATRAVDFFQPMMMQQDHGENLALRALLVEAWQALGREDQARANLEAMSRIYRIPIATATGTAPTTTRSASTAGAGAPTTAATSRPAAASPAEQAWFHLMFLNQPKAALELAGQAAQSPGDDRFVQRVLGAAQLAAGQTDAGIQTLRPLAGKDPYAAAILARHYYAGKNAAAARQTLLEGVGEVRTGPGWRMLQAVATEHGVSLPPPKNAQAIRDALKELPQEVVQLGRYPERFLAVKLTPVKEQFVPGEPLEFTVELRNTSGQPIPLGQWGVFNPVLFLSLAIEGEVRGMIPNLTAITLPAPKYLPPGGKVVETVRLDVGQAEGVLAACPLAKLKLIAVAMLDPLQEGDRMFSSVPELAIEPGACVRAALFSTTGDKDAAQYALAYIVRDLKEGDLPTQMRAARQTAALLAHVRLAEAGKAQPVFPEVLTKPVLLSMTRAFLRAGAPAVRAEMVSALNCVDLDERTIALLNPSDPSPLVRLRLIELLAGKRTPGYQGLLNIYLKDEDALVRQLAAALGKK